MDFLRFSSIMVEIPNGWQPMETAPRDGTPILVYGKGRKEVYDTDVVIDRYQERFDDANGSGWGRFNKYHYPPTHWMPLPAPPDA